MVLARQRWTIILVFLVGVVAPMSAQEVLPPVVMLPVAPMRIQSAEDGDWYRPDLFYREIIRQAVLLAAREDLELSTRDAALREVSSDGRTQIDLTVVAENVQAKRLEFSIKSRDTTLAQGEIPYGFSSSKSGTAQMAEKAEVLSASEFVRALEQIEAIQKHRQLVATHKQESGTSDTLPTAIEELLQTMELPSQLIALRMAHAHQRQHGASLESLSALARGYAHLSQLTNLHLTNERFTYAARGLLYASRMVRQFPDSPAGYWHQAYVFTLIGLTKDSMWQLDRAKTLAQRQPVTDPEWMKLVTMANDFDLLGLATTLAEQRANIGLGALLCFRSVETAGSDYAALEIGKNVLTLSPGNIRIVQGMDRLAGVSYRHGTTGRCFEMLGKTLEESLPRLKSHDDSLRRCLDDLRIDPNDPFDRHRLVKALNDAASRDVREPSLSVLGQLIDATDVLSIAQRVNFLFKHLGTSPDSFIEAVQPILVDHPHGALIGSFRDYNNSKLSDHLSEVVVEDPNFLSVFRLLLREIEGDIKLKQETVAECQLRMYDSVPAFDMDYAQKIDYSRQSAAVQMARWMVDINPKSPKRISSLIRLDWDESQDDIDRWLEKYGHHPAVVGALGDQYYAHGDMEKAESMYKKYIELAPEYKAYRVVASLQYRRGELDQALKTAEKFLETEDFGLEHARMQQRAARTLMAEGDYAAAMKWAEGTAQSYSAWGLLTLAECLERRGDFEECLRVLHAIDERYGNHMAYYFVARTGKGDLAEEFRRARADYVRKYGEGSEDVENREAWHAFFSGDYADAAPRLDKVYQDKVTADLYLVAFAADKAKDKTMRDRVLGRIKEILEKSEAKDKDQQGTQNYITMVSSLLKGEKLDPSFGDGMTHASASAFYRFHFLLGWCHEQSGDRERAIKHYTLAATGDKRDDREAIIAWRELVRLGVDPQTLKFRYTTF